MFGTRLVRPVPFIPAGLRLSAADRRVLREGQLHCWCWFLCAIRQIESCPSTSGPWTLIWKKYERSSVERDKLFFDPVWLVPWITHMMAGKLKDTFSCKESQILLSDSKVKQCFLWDRSVNYMSTSLEQYTSSMQTWLLVWQRGKVSKEVTTIINQVMLEGKCTDVSYMTGTYFHKLIYRLFDDTDFLYMKNYHLNWRTSYV